MSKEYLVPPNPNIGMGPQPQMQPQMQPQPPKKDNRVVILLSVILVLLLAIITVAVLIFMKPDGEGESEKQSQSQSAAVSENDFSQGTADFPNGGDTPQSDPNPGEADNKPTAMTQDEFIRFLNAETAKAAKGSYTLKRSGEFVKPIDVGSAADALNSIIKGVDKNADLNSVVGGFIGIKSDPILGSVSNGSCSSVDAKYLLKAMNLTSADILQFAVSPDGTQYAFQIGNVSNPDANSALAHITNDYITFAEVNKVIYDSVDSAVKVEESSSTANYTRIAFVVTVVDGKITKITYSYTLSATLKIKLIVMSATGTFEADIKGEITDIKY